MLLKFKLRVIFTYQRVQVLWQVLLCYLVATEFEIPAIFSVGFLMDFSYSKLTGKVANGDHISVTHCNVIILSWALEHPVT